MHCLLLCCVTLDELLVLVEEVEGGHLLELQLYFVILLLVGVIGSLELADIVQHALVLPLPVHPMLHISLSLVLILLGESPDLVILLLHHLFILQSVLLLLFTQHLLTLQLLHHVEPLLLPLLLTVLDALGLLLPLSLVVPQLL